MKQINTSLPISGYWDTRQGGRPENQDSCGFIDTSLGLLAIVCDGMGGGPSGQLASATAVKRIAEYVMNAPAELSRQEVMKNAVEYAHQNILQMGLANPSLRGMGTTVAAVLVNDYSAVIAHVGDSRVYQFRRKRKIFRTADHSMVAELVRNGTLTEEQARLSSQSNLITKALGGQLNDLADVTERPYEKGDRFMICTDGIWGMLNEKELLRRTAKTPSLSGAVDGTVVQIDEIGRKEGNMHDNMTLAMLEMKTDSKLKEKMSKKTLIIMSVLAAVCLISLIANCFLAAKVLKPTDQGKKIDQLTTMLKDKEQQVDTLQKQINALKDAAADAKVEAADAKVEAADAKVKEADAKMKEAEQQKKEAEQKAKEAEQKTSAAKPSQASSSEITALREEVINILQTASNTFKGESRKANCQKAIDKLGVLIQKDNKNKTVYQEAIDALKQPIATRNEDKVKKDVKGHYGAIIRKLKAIK